MESGYWLCLKNFHLNLKCYNEIRRTLSDSRSIHGSFRLWIISEPSQNIPMSLLKESMKILLRIPDGLVPNIRRSLAIISVHFVDGNIFSLRILFLLTFFHSIILERTRYNSWNQRYSFSSNVISSAAALVFHLVYSENLEALHDLIMSYSHGLRIDATRQQKKKKTEPTTLLLLLPWPRCLL